MIIGLTGNNGAGKGEVANFLKEQGFIYHSLSDAIRDELRARGEAVKRKTLITAGNNLRAQFGPSVLADRILPKLHLDKNYVIDSVRNPYEARALKQRPDSKLLFVTAPLEVRFRRVQQRARGEDPHTLEEFKRLEDVEETSDDANTQQLAETRALADLEVENTGTVEELHAKVRQVLAELSRTTSRPDWDEYFMGIARVVALRSNCVKRKVAAVLVKDKRIISTGYNGTPRGVKNCNEGGCPRCNSFVPSGTQLDQCLCSHAEENAITQAAYHGVNIKGATLYSTYSSCLICTKMIINSGISEVVFNVEYPLENISRKLLGDVGIVVRQLTVEQL